MTKKNNDYYDYDNKLQNKPQIWKCTKCSKQIKVLAAEEVAHRCPSNKSKLVHFERI
jgi:DNA-directed RNA polymerase subunit RPC12/RpoP